MIAKISGGSAGTCKGLAEYLEKEQQGQWFSHNREELQAPQVVQHIDANKRNLGREDTKFYQVILSPSERELVHIGCDPDKLKAYTRDVMEGYAQNFGKGIESKDLVWYAKIEHSRHYSHQDRPVQTGQVERGQLKEGENMHVHIIVSRTEDLARFKTGQQTGEVDRKNPLKLSPATNHRDTGKGAVTGGFDRIGFKVATEQRFDQRFAYDRPLKETFTHANTLAHGDQEQRLKAHQDVRQDEAHRATRQAQQQESQRQPVEGTRQRVAEPPRDESIKPRLPEQTPTERGPKLSDPQKELIRTLLEKLDEPLQRGQRLRPNGPSL
jgi:hypothetical protein